MDEILGDREAVEFVRTDLLWEFLNNLTLKISSMSQLKEVKGSEGCRLLLFGRQEMVEAFMDFVEENSMDFQTLCSSLGLEIRTMEDS